MNAARPALPTYRRSYWMYAALIGAAYVIVRIIVILSLNENLVFLEEEFIGTSAAKAFQTPLAHQFDLQLTVYAGGTLFSAYLVAAGFALFGKSMLILKCIPLIFGLGILLIASKLLHESFGIESMLWFAACFTFAPPSLVETSVVLWGSHFEGQIFAISILWLGYKLHRSRTPSIMVMILIGFLLGFGIWFTLENAFALFIILGFVALAASPFQLVRKIHWFALGTAAGISPWIVYNLVTDWAGWRWILDKNMNLSLHETWRNLLNLTLHNLPRSFGYEEVFSFRPEAIAAIALAIFGIAMIMLLPVSAQGGRCWVLIIPAFIALSLYVDARSKFAYPPYHGVHTACYEYRYLTPLYTWFFLALAISTGAAAQARNAIVRNFPRGVSILLLAIGIVSFFSLAPISQAGGKFNARDWNRERSQFELQTDQTNKKPPPRTIMPLNPKAMQKTPLPPQDQILQLQKSH
jgi:hypothetical protein